MQERLEKRNRVNSSVPSFFNLFFHHFIISFLGLDWVGAVCTGRDFDLGIHGPGESKGR